MENEEFNRMYNMLKQATTRYPTCKIANCECDELNNEWVKGCYCLGHWLQLDKWFGKNNWDPTNEAEILRETGVAINTKVASIKNQVKTTLVTKKVKI